MLLDHLEKGVRFVLQALYVSRTHLRTVVKVEDVLDEAFSDVYKDQTVHIIHITIAKQGRKDLDGLIDVQLVFARHVVQLHLGLLLIEVPLEDALVGLDAALDSGVVLLGDCVQMLEAPSKELFVRRKITLNEG